MNNLSELLAEHRRKAEAASSDPNWKATLGR
jgi:hypothetical protein